MSNMRFQGLLLLTVISLVMFGIFVQTAVADTGRLELAKKIDYWSRRLFPGAFVALALKSLLF